MDPSATPDALPGTSPPRRRSRRLLIGLALVVAVAGRGVRLRAAYLQQQRHAALSLVTEDRFAEAEPVLRQIAERSPADAEVAAALGRGYLEQGELAGAEQFINRWCQLQPEE